MLRSNNMTKRSKLVQFHRESLRAMWANTGITSSSCKAVSVLTAHHLSAIGQVLSMGEERPTSGHSTFSQAQTKQNSECTGKEQQDDRNF